MADLWERVKSNAEERISSHLVIASLRAYMVNGIDSNKGATAAQVKDAINANLAESGHTLLTAGEETDLSNIAAAIDAQANNIQKLLYVQVMEYAFIAAEEGAINEPKWRNDLEI